MVTFKPRRVLGYCRVSSAEQALGTSLEDQQNVIKRHAKANGWPEPVLYVEAESGIHEHNEKRERMQALMRDIREGDLVLVDKIDRWSRNIVFTHTSVPDIIARGARIYFIGDGCDPSTDHGDTMLTMRATFAKEEHKRIRIRTVGARDRLQREGYFAQGQVPRGYRRQESDSATVRNTLAIVPEEAEQIRALFARYLAGETIRTVAKTLGLSNTFAANALKNRLYAGEVQLPASVAGKKDGEWIKGKHEAIIDRDVFSRVQTLLTKNRVGGVRPHGGPSGTSGWILRDVAYCSNCGSKMGSNWNDRGGEKIGIYTCLRQCMTRGIRKPTPHRVPVVEIEAVAVYDVTDRITAIRDFLANPHQEPKKAKTTKATDAATKRAKLIERREALLEQNADGFITRETLRERMAKVDAEIALLDAADVAASKPEPLADPKVRQAMLADLRELGRAFQGMTGEEMRKVVNVFVERCGMTKDAPPVWTWRGAEDVKQRLDVVRDALVAGLGRAPTRAELVERLTHGMAEAWTEPPPSSQPAVVAPKKAKATGRKTAAKKTKKL